MFLVIDKEKTHMRLIFIGPPGAGKGTQAAFVSQRLHIPKISTGEMLRMAVKLRPTLAVEIKAIMDSGGLVSDDTIMYLVSQRLLDEDCEHGYLFDGFPRTVVQAVALRQQNIGVDYVVELDVPSEEIVSRMEGRLTHPKSGRVYHALYNPPRVAGQDDLTGETLVSREDDCRETVLKRLEIYYDQTSPLINFYKAWEVSGIDSPPRYRKINATGSVEDIRQRIFSALSLLS